jgi:LPS-assembly protein
MDVWPRIYYPYFLPPYLTIEPSVGFRQTVWDQYQTEDSDTWSDDGYFHRELYDARLVVGTYIYNTYDVDGERLKRIKHRVMPEVTYTYVPEADQDNLPNIDSRDRIENRSRIGYSLTNTLTSKLLRRPSKNQADQGEDLQSQTTDSVEGYDYRDVLRWKIAQYYDFARHVQPFSPLVSKLTLAPEEDISLDHEVAYNTYTDQVDRFNLSMRLGAKKKDHLSIGYRYARNTSLEERNPEYEYGQIIEPEGTTQQQRINQIYTESRVGLTDRFSLIASYGRDLVFDRNSSYGLGFIYESQCWALETVFGLAEEDIGLSMRIRLKGIGDFGL